MATEQENVTLEAHQWNVIMDVLRLDATGQDANHRLGDVASQVNEILNELQR